MCQLISEDSLIKLSSFICTLLGLKGVALESSCQWYSRLLYFGASQGAGRRKVGVSLSAGKRSNSHAFEAFAPKSAEQELATLGAVMRCQRKKEGVKKSPQQCLQEDAEAI